MLCVDVGDDTKSSCDFRGTTYYFDPSLKMPAPVEFAVAFRFLFFTPKGGLPPNHEIHVRWTWFCDLECIELRRARSGWTGMGWVGLAWVRVGRAGLHGIGLASRGLD